MTFVSTSDTFFSFKLILIDDQKLLYFYFGKIAYFFSESESDSPLSLDEDLCLAEVFEASSSASLLDEPLSSE